jgi:hypothetical protein
LQLVVAGAAAAAADDQQTPSSSSSICRNWPRNKRLSYHSHNNKDSKLLTWVLPTLLAPRKSCSGPRET